MTVAAKALSLTLQLYSNHYQEMVTQEACSTLSSALRMSGDSLKVILLKILARALRFDPGLKPLLYGHEVCLRLPNVLQCQSSLALFTRIL